MRRARVRAGVAKVGSGRSASSRLRLTVSERDLLGAIGGLLSEARAFDVAAAVAGERANDRYKANSARFGIHSRYAGSICADNDALVKAHVDALYRQRTELRRATETLRRRLAGPSRRACGCGRRDGCGACADGYATDNEKAQKWRRLGVLEGRLAEVERRLAERDYAIVLGGRRRANGRHHLETAGLSVEGWRSEWEQARWWFAPQGNQGRPGGNPCLRLEPDESGRVWLTVSVPKPVQRRLGVGPLVRLSHPVPLGHCPELVERLRERLAVRVALGFEADGKGGEKAIVRVSWTGATVPSLPSLDLLRTGRILGVDLNADHLAAAVIDADGNPLGRPRRIPLELDGLPAQLRDTRMREAITELTDTAKAAGAGGNAVEQLGFELERTREKHGRRKAFRRLISGFPTLAFRERLVAMAARAGLAVIAVDPAYTSKIGGRDWAWILKGGPTATRTTTPSTEGTTDVVTRHDGAAVAIGRRALAYGLGADTPARRKANSRPSKSRHAPHRRSQPPSTVGPGRKDGSTSRQAQVRQTGLRPQTPNPRQANRPKAARSSTRTPSATTLRMRRRGLGEGSPGAGRTAQARPGTASPQPPAETERTTAA